MSIFRREIRALPENIDPYQITARPYFPIFSGEIVSETTAFAHSALMAAVTLLADGNATYTKALGLELDASGFGMGTRGQRFAMIVVDGVVKNLFVEAPGKFEVSSAENVLANL